MPEIEEEDRFLPTAEVVKRYQIHVTSLDRWLRIESNFPRPIMIAGRKYWSLRALQEFERNAVAEKQYNPGRFLPNSNRKRAV